MADLIKNVQDIYKKWEDKASREISSRGRHNTPQSRTVRRCYQRDDQFASSSRNVFDNRSGYCTRTVPFRSHDALAQFKRVPSVVTEKKQRPFMGSCCAKCLPMSRATVADKSLFSLSICNVLQMPYPQTVMVDIKELLSFFKRKSVYPDVSTNVLNSEIVSSAIREATDRFFSEEEECDGSLSEKKATYLSDATNVISSLKTSVSSVVLPVGGLFLHQILCRLFGGVLIHKGQMEITKTFVQDDIPVVYIPMLITHLDYALISFALFMHSIKVPLVAVDADLFTPTVGWFTKFLGALYISRRILPTDDGNENDIERAVIQSYLAEILKAGYSLEVPISSNSGREKQQELFNLMLDLMERGIIEDINISTIAISYENVPKENLINEQLGQFKEPKSVFSHLYSIWKLLHFNFGNVRLNFGQPFSLVEFLRASKLRNQQLQNSTESSAELGLTDQKPIIEDLFHHVIYDATTSTALMSTQLVAFLLAVKFRRGATRQQLVQLVEWLRGELSHRKRDIGFTGDSSVAVIRALGFLGSHLVSMETIEVEWTSSDLANNNLKVTVYKPVTTLPSILELQYFARPVVSIFLLDSMLVNALYALVDVEICHFRHCDSKLFVSRESLIDTAMELSDILQFEFVAVPPCTDITLSFSECLDQLIEKEYLHLSNAEVLSNQGRGGNRPRRTAYDMSGSESDEDCIKSKEKQLKVDLNEESINHLEFLRNILSPYIESYWLAAITLFNLIDEVMEESMLIKEMQETAREKLYRGFLAYEESFSARTFSNALKLFEKWNVLEHYVQDGVKVVYLNESCNSKEIISDIIAKIEEYRK